MTQKPLRSALALTLLVLAAAPARAEDLNVRVSCYSSSTNSGRRELTSAFRSIRAEVRRYQIRIGCGSDDGLWPRTNGSPNVGDLTAGVSVIGGFSCRLKLSAWSKAAGLYR